MSEGLLVGPPYPYPRSLGPQGRHCRNALTFAVLAKALCPSGTEQGQFQSKAEYEDTRSLVDPTWEGGRLKKVRLARWDDETPQKLNSWVTNMSRRVEKLETDQDDKDEWRDQEEADQLRSQWHKVTSARERVELAHAQGTKTAGDIQTDLRDMHNTLDGISHDSKAGYMKDHDTFGYAKWNNMFNARSNRGTKGQKASTACSFANLRLASEEHPGT